MDHITIPVPLKENNFNYIVVKNSYKKTCYWKWVKKKNNRLREILTIFTEKQMNYNDEYT